METRMVTVSIPAGSIYNAKAQEYIDRVERKRRRDEARTIRRCQKFADDLFNMALGAFSLFVVFAILISI